MKELIKSLNELALKDKKSLLKTVSYTFKPTENISVKINSFRINEFAFNKQQLPISARGLFISEEDEILIRGYDKFFNIGETDLSSYSWLRANTRGPYEITVKENGCIIFVASVKGHLLVTSKHAIDGTHALKGNEWLLKHLDSANQTKEAFSNYLSENNYTAVFELADDDFEEHVLEYSKENSGLYLHGLNKNTPELISEPMSVVHDTCKRFGFHNVECLYRDTIELVQDFASGISSKGFYNGKPVEGFVVRCHRTDLNPNRIHFFKIKFERPYLMFREWREITKALLSKNPRNPRYRYELSKQYIDWVRIKVRTHPHLFQDFLKGKGIILVRNMFLKQVMQLDTFAGTDLNALCAESVSTEDDQLGKGKSLILPIGTIGIGKTTLGRTLLNLFPDKVFHVQNDNITQKRASHIFESQILDAFQTYDIVYADRNNHLFPMRKSVCEAFKKVYPKGIIYALDWGVDSIDKKSLLDLTIQRVEKRGENHQSLTPGRNKNYHKVLSGFIYHRDPITLNNPADSLIDYVIKFNINSTVSENITILCTHMHLTPPNEINQALEKALDYKETIIKTIQSKPRYYAIQIQQNLNTLLSSEFPNADFLKQFPFKDEWHVTVAHRSNDKLIQFYDKRAENILLPSTTVTMKISKVLWNNEIITIPIDSSEPYFESINEHIHVTFAMQEQVNAIKSNDLLREYYKGSNVNMVEFKEPKVLTGHLVEYF
jgi:tRNA ligase